MPYNPSSRAGAVYRANHKYGKYRLAWLTCHLGEFIVSYNTQVKDGMSELEIEELLEDGIQPESGERPTGPSVEIAFRKRLSLKRIVMNLSNCSEQELKYLGALWELAIDLAMPTAIHRDKEARDAISNGDDSFSRSYRPIPVWAVRTGKGVEYPESLRDRLESLSRGELIGEDYGREYRRTSSDLAPRQPVQSESENDESKTDESESIRPVGTDSDSQSE